MLLRTENIEYFLKTVQTGSINKASELLHLNHQNLGKIIMSLENEIGMKLLNRNHTGISLTEDGKYILLKFQEIETILNEIRTYAKQQENTEEIDLFFYLSSGIYTRPIISKILNLKKKYPNVNTIIEDCPFKTTLRNIYNNENAIGNLVADTEEIKTLPKDLNVIFGKKYDIVAYVPAKHPLAERQTTVSVKTLEKEKVIMFYSSYDINFNNLYNKLNGYSDLKNVQIISNISTYYEVMRTGEYLGLGLFLEQLNQYNSDEFSKLFFNNNHYFKKLPIYENGAKLTLQSAWVTRKDVMSRREVEYFLAQL